MEGYLEGLTPPAPDITGSSINDAGEEGSSKEDILKEPRKRPPRNLRANQLNFSSCTYVYYVRYLCGTKKKQNVM